MDSANSHRSRARDRRLAVVSGYATRRLTPRGQRTQWLLKRLEPEWDVDLIALPGAEPAAGGTSDRGQVSWRRAAGGVVRATLFDKWEPWSMRRFRSWGDDLDAGLLIAYPWSPVAHAARRLQSADTPYVVDAGDPWALTSPGTDTRFLATLRCKRAERSIWSGAAGAVVTTEQQATVLADLFPQLQVLVRPNGYDPPPVRPAVAAGDATRDPERLRLVHYGMLSFLRLDVTELLGKLVASGRWKSIVFTQFGDDHAGMLRRVPAGVEVERRPACPWDEVLAGAHEFDLAVVVGNWLTGQLPSKAIQYMTLPLPRLALTQREHDDALADYVRGRSGWLAVGIDDADAGDRVREHVDRDWSEAELAPPPDEAWPAVADRIGDFVEQRVGSADVPARERVA